jgi:guanylate kinase
VDRGKIIVVSAPSGTGKTTIVRKVLACNPSLVFSVSATTRQKRDTEVHGKDYFFITEEEFVGRIDNNEFAEWEKVYDYYYGTFKYFIEETILSGKNIILELDVNGAIALKSIYNEANLIYILPPDFDELIKRLKNRKTETEADLQKRIERAKMELSMKDKFDYLVLNKDLDIAVEETKSLIKKIINQKEETNGNYTG